MRFGSVCSGIEAASVAWEPLGWKAAWFSEIEPFPCAVLAHHYPSVPNLGDMTTLPNRILEGEVEAPDVFCGGTPCQAFSVAGKRQSLDDARGNLSLVFCEIANAIDDVRRVAGQQPTIVFWENVPGVLSTKDNAFGCFLGELAGEDCAIEPPRGKWTNAGCVYGPKRTVAWRVLDAQYFGVAQRRRRVFVVASARTDIDPAAILFEFDGLRRDIAPSRKAGQEVAARARKGIVGGIDYEGNGHGANEPTGPLLKGSPTGGGHPLPAIAFAQNTRDEVRLVGGDGSIVGALAAQAGMKQTSYVAQPIAYGVGESPDLGHCLRSGASKADKHESTTYVAHPMAFQSSQSGVRLSDTHATLDANNGPRRHNGVLQPVAFKETADCLTAAYGTKWNGNASATNGSLFVAHPMPINTMIALRHEALGERTGFGIGEPGDPAFTITKGHSHAVAQPAFGFLPKASPAAGSIGFEEEMAPTFKAGCPSYGVLKAGMAVRRLTPVECERLQGFPDDYTLIPWRKKPASECPDGPRYKALGNSWAVPNVRWIGHRIQLAVEIAGGAK